MAVEVQGPLNWETIADAFYQLERRNIRPEMLRISESSWARLSADGLTDPEDDTVWGADIVVDDSLTDEVQVIAGEEKVIARLKR